MNEREYQHIVAKGMVSSKDNVAYVIDSLFNTLTLHLTQAASASSWPAARIYAEACTKDMMFLVDAARETSDLFELVRSYVKWKALCFSDGEYHDPPREIIAAHYRVKRLLIKTEDEHEW